MTQEDFLKEFDSLPLEGQRQVASFIALLRERYRRSESSKELETSSLTQESFIGMWRDRKDVQDSSLWVRNLREREWVK